MHTTKEPEKTRPQAFIHYGALGPFSDAIGELWFRKSEDGRFLTQTAITADHANNLGVPHGGFLCTLADNSMGACVRHSTGHRYVTVNLSIDFIGRAPNDSLIEVSSTLRKTGKRLCFVECVAAAQGLVIFTAKGIFQRVDVRQHSDQSMDGDDR